MLRVFFDAFRRAVRAAVDEREEVARSALVRMLHGVVHVAFTAWHEHTAVEQQQRREAAAEAERKEAEAAARREAALREMGQGQVRLHADCF